jgi:hypothetical protein
MTPGGMPLADPLEMGFRRTPFPTALGGRQSPVPHPHLAARVAAAAGPPPRPRVTRVHAAPGLAASVFSGPLPASLPRWPNGPLELQWPHGVPLEGSTQSGAGGKYWSLEFAAEQRLEALARFLAGGGGGSSRGARQRRGDGDGQTSDGASLGSAGTQSLGSLTTTRSAAGRSPTSSTASRLDGRHTSSRAGSSPFRARTVAPGSGYGGDRRREGGGGGTATRRAHLWPTRDAADDWRPVATSLTHPIPRGRYGP